MLIFILAAVVASAPTAIDVERAFSRDAQKNGQWTASRAYADPDAVRRTLDGTVALTFRYRPKADIEPHVCPFSCGSRAVCRGGYFVRVRQTVTYFLTPQI